jgi:hypothetical protein
MGSNERRLSYSIAFKVEVVNYAEKHGNWAVKMTFYMKKVTHRVKTTAQMILVAVTMMFWVSMMNYGR